MKIEILSSTEGFWGRHTFTEVENSMTVLVIGSSFSQVTPYFSIFTKDFPALLLQEKK